MRCDDVHETLSSMLDGEASAEELAGAGAHLGGCTGCRDHWEDLRRDRALVRSWPDETSRAPSAPGAGTPRLRPLRLAAAALLFGVGLALGLGVGRTPQAAKPRPPTLTAKPVYLEESWAVFPARNEIRAAGWLRNADPSAARLQGGPQ